MFASYIPENDLEIMAPTVLEKIESWTDLYPKEITIILGGQ